MYHEIMSYTSVLNSKNNYNKTIHNDKTVYNSIDVISFVLDNTIINFLSTLSSDIRTWILRIKISPIKSILPNLPRNIEWICIVFIS